ncbi:MAG: cyclase, partial [Coleofasciculaceae cyanobacterium]
MTSGQNIVPSEPNQPSQSSNISDNERWGTLISGGALVLMGLKQGSLRGAITALTGGGLIYRGVTAQNSIKDDIQDTLGM